MLEAPALVSCLQDVAVMGEPLEQRQILDGTIRRFSGESGAGSSLLAWTWDDVSPTVRPPRPGGSSRDAPPPGGPLEFLPKS